MSSLAELVSDPAVLLRRVKATAPEPLALRRAAKAISGEASEARDQRDTAALQEMVLQTAKAEGLSHLSRRELRDACRVFLSPPTPLGEDPEVGPLLVDEVDRLKRRAAFFALIDAYLDRFESDSEAVANLGVRLAKLAKTWPWRAEDLWPQRTKEFALFDPVQAPARLAAAMLRSDVPPRTTFERAGLAAEGRRKGGLAEASFRAACRLVSEKRGPAAIPLQSRVLAWAKDGGSPLAYPKAWPEFASALFMPWSSSEPDAEHRGLLIDAAVSYAGDPRVREGAWRPVRAVAGGAYDIIVRWLTKASVEQFFDIVEETTDRPDMWAERRRFWTSYLKKDMISAAWVAFGSDGAWRAEQAAKRANDSGLSMFGRLASGGGRTAEHAALLMRIGDLTVVEWSHNGRWNIWPKGDKGRPELFRHNSKRWPDYEPRELMHAPVSGVHKGSWQTTVADIIRKETGLRP